MSRFSISATPLPPLRVVERRRIEDRRGFLSRLFSADELAAAGWRKSIVQINHTLTRERGTVRGMHFQRAPHAEMKVVACIRGAVFDVAVDVRASSSTYLRWHAEELSAENGRALLIPEGFAHGFQALTADAELIYLHSEAYTPGSEAGLHPADPALGVAWPLPITVLSERDSMHPMSSAFQGE